MSFLSPFFYFLLKFPLRLLLRFRIVPDQPISKLNTNSSDVNKEPIFYVIRHQSASDLLALQRACKKLDLPDPLSKYTLGDKKYPRTLCLEKPSSIFPWRKRSKTNAIADGLSLLDLHQKNSELDAQLIPINIVWGRTPTKEKANVGTLLADEDSPNWLRKLFIVMFLGRDTLIRFSEPVSIRYMSDHHGASTSTARKLMRVARFHFHRQTIAATGPRLMHRNQMFTALFANPSIHGLLKDEAKSKVESPEKVKKRALKIMDEIAGDYRDSMVRFGANILSWLWKRLYSEIKVKNADRLRQLAQDGHEIIYMPCHKSHMDYLLLTSIIYRQGLVIPRIAAGINLNFWPAGPIFRRAGAFFIRRSFAGNRLYSTIFREYLGLLFNRGYPVKFYTEGGRSRTGRLLQPKTGMMSMTIQSMLKGLDRPISVVPVYLGYEHVMEVSSYHKELKGSSKQKESFLGIFKAIRKLRNYGRGFVSFGEPINLSDQLTALVPNWKDNIDEIDPQKPNWLTPSANTLTNQVMTAINKAAALNSVALTAMVLLTQKNRALEKSVLASQLDFLLSVQKNAAYSDQIHIPDETGAQLVESVLKLNKVEHCDDDLGVIISLTDEQSLEMTYYRNNILHLYMLPALVCRVLEQHAKISTNDIQDKVFPILQIIKPELFLWQNNEDVKQQTEQVLAFLEEDGICKCSKAGFWTKVSDSQQLFKLSILAEVASETLQRFAIVLAIINESAPIDRKSLEADAVTLAKRLSVLHDINAPEFVDKHVQRFGVNTLKDLLYINLNENSELQQTDKFESLRENVFSLLDIEVLQSIGYISESE